MKDEDLNLGGEVDKEAQKEELDAEVFLEYFKSAKEVGLEAEFVIYFLREFRKTQDVHDACWYAACEWDF